VIDISPWLIVLAVLAIIIAAFARSFGEVRLEQTPGPMDAERWGTCSPAVTDAQPRGMVNEDQKELNKLLDARTNVQHQLDVLMTATHGAGPPSRRLTAILKEIDERIAELRSDRAEP
jgi:hypothetical protein